MKVLMIGLLSLLSITSHAESERGNGGGAFVCRNSQKAVISATLVDLYEGSERYGLAMSNPRGSVDDVLDQVMAKVYRALPQAGQTIDSNARKIKFEMIKKPGIILSKTPDFELVVQPAACIGGKISFEQLAYYGTDGRLNVSKDIYDKLGLAGQVGLILHEAIYKYSRDTYDSPTSTESRRFVAYTLSKLDVANFPKDAADLRPSNDSYPYTCSALGVAGVYDNYNGTLKKLREFTHVLVGYGTSLTTAVADLKNNIMGWDPAAWESTKAITVCGVDSDFTMPKEITKWDWGMASNGSDIIHCARQWSTSIDCKKREH